MRAIKDECTNRLREKGVSDSSIIERMGHTVIVVYDRLWDRHYEVVRGHLDLLAALALAWAAHAYSLYMCSGG